jgi:hypothetical protein
MIRIIWNAASSRYSGPKGAQTVKGSIMSWSWRAGLAGIAIAAATAYAVAQMGPGPQGMQGPMGTMMSPPRGTAGPMHDHHQMMQGQQGMHGPMGHHAMMIGQQTGATGQPTMPGQDAFGTIQEVVQILEADPTTDWSKVNIAALREHLVDMNEVTLRAVAHERALDNGVEVMVTGEGRTLEAIQRMVPAHARELSQIGWSAKTEDLPNGVKLVVTTTDPKQLTKLKGLGFMGIMVQGAHHQPHHLMMAKGEFNMH